MNFLKILNKKGDKFVFYRDFGRGKGQRVSTGFFSIDTQRIRPREITTKKCWRLLN